MPWHIPAALLFLVGTLLFAITQPLRARSDTPSSPISSDTTPLEATREGDPLADPAVSPSELEDATRIAILLLGTDGRDEQDGPPRTDLMMLLLLERTPARATLISLPRDLWVPIPGYGEGKLNTAYFLGELEGEGADLARQTVEGVAGLPIQHTIQLDFNGFRTLIDEMGGVEVEVPTTIDDPDYPDGNYGTLHLQIPAGRQKMDGETALRYARTRHGGTDQERSARQQALLMALREQALRPAHLARAPLYLRALYREVESDLTLADFFELARFGRALDSERLTMHTLNGELTWPVLTWNGQDALLYDPAEVQAAIAAWRRGQEGE